MGPNGPISRKSLVKLPNQNFYQKFKLNRNLLRLPIKMMYNMFMLRHRPSNEPGEGGALNQIPVLFCKSVYILMILWATFMGKEPERIRRPKRSENSSVFLLEYLRTN